MPSTFARKLLPAVIFVCLFAFESAAQQAATAAAPSAPPSAAASRRADELIALLNSGDRAAVRAYVNDHFSRSSNERVPLEQRVNNFSRLHDTTRGVELLSVRGTKPNEIAALVRSKLTGQLSELIVEVEPEAPHRVNRMGLGPASDAARPARKLTDAELTRELDAFIQKLAGADIFSGAVLVARNGEPLFKKAYGEANKDFAAPNRVDTKFNLGSMNKMFTAVAIAQLVERGKLSFDDPLSKFLPDFPSKEAAEKVKIKHLLTHTSGLGSYFNQQFVEGSRARFRSVDDFLALAKNETLQFEPGARWSYSNTGFLVLGKIVEKVSGQSYYDYVRAETYVRAGMTNTVSYELDSVNPNLAVGYQKEYSDAGATFRNNIFAHVIRGGPAGGGYSTVEDLLRFDVALRSGKLVGPEYVKLLLAPKPELNSPEYGYGFGYDADLNTAGHTGGFLGISSSLDMYLGNGYTAVVMSNYGGGMQPVNAKIQELIQAATR
ncbi:MAG TPA: serine hydrolase domain-containing protein [Pyrinomonadaceae bacterium]|nr:serine hydrolase domain-containing protein [Pyrinomonadaceae bacterium]